MAKPTLDGLPIELRVSILREVSDFTSLRALLLASREYYRAYDNIRPRILFELLFRQYNGQVDFVESLTTIRSKGLWAEDAKNTEDIIALLDFRRRASKEGNLPKYDHDSLTIKELVQLLKLHETASFLLEDYSKSLEQPDWWQSGTHGVWKPVRFSSNERTRFFRAFYRLQTWCHIFGHMEYYPIRPTRETDQFINDWYGKTFSAADAWRLLWGTMPPWEVEEVGCIWLYCDNKYLKIFEEIRDTLLERFVPRYPGAPPTVENHLDGDLVPEGTPMSSIDELESERAHIPRIQPIQNTNFLSFAGMDGCSRRDEMIAIGLCFFAKVLRSNNEEREKAILNNLRRPFWTSVDRELWQIGRLGNNERLPLLSPADRYEREDLADVISSWPLLEQPNQAWIKYWCAGTPLHPDIWLIYPLGHGVPTCALDTGEWDWGYVLWDTERILQWNPPVLEQDFDPWQTFTRRDT
ncbi:hypothetical protein UA08_02377 [Talaromyces atroroseus]|uniref:Uncharacterized protein n=1 Tax=Talaromyces atroroseus TaxID=1441469 RepID=A0A225B9H0_TALAT|nr:hypothetical protein UA08_02377 [Talaromyces atroroseus]OKL62597.1 hypothetical protein UA08_02377 [Talaromyces atroroseus]